MKNRNSSVPILCVAALLLVFHPPLLSRAQTEGANRAPVVSAPPSTASGPAAAPAKAHTASYTVVAGDSLTSIAKKFNTTRKKLEAINNLASTKLKPGQILEVPSRKNAAITSTTPKAKPHHTYLVAQPVQDFDIPASTFGSCPVPLPSPDEDTDSAAPGVAEKPAPIAKLVSPAELAAESAKQNIAKTTYPTRGGPTDGSSADGGYSQQTFNINPHASKLISRGSSQGTHPNPLITTPASDWGNRFLQEARALANEGIDYDEDWRPPGESQAWAMDCSNTARYIYKVTTGIQLPRTASDQYYYLHLQGKAWDVPQTANGFVDTEFLRHNLKPGDLLFWENTYRPERQPPITHVMVFLGTNANGQWIMAGSQTSRGGEHNRSNGGPDIYVFRPSQPCGGYTTWLGLVHHQGRFCAFGRPLEADRTKLAVAANE